MSKKALLSAMFIISLTGASIGVHTTLARAAAASSIDPQEIKTFEHSYENWLKGIVKSVVPTASVTVKVDFHYNTSKAKIENYLGARKEDHLPGLPEVSDPHFSTPSQSPVDSLVTRRQIKIAFESPVTQAQFKTIAQLISNKVKLNVSHGDSLTLTRLNTPIAQANASSPKRENAAIAFTVFLVAGLFSTRRKTPVLVTAENRSNPIQNPVPPKVAAIQKVIARQQKSISKMKRVNPTLSWYSQKALDPIQFILKANTKVLLVVIRNEKAIVIGQAIQGTTETFSATLLRLCSRQQRNEIRNLLVAQKKPVSTAQIRYQQILIAAKVHRQTKKFKEMTEQLDRLIEAQHQRTEAKREFEEAKHALVQAVDQANQENQENTPTPQEALNETEKNSLE